MGHEWSHKGSEPLISRRKKKIPTVWERQNCGDSKKISGCQEFAERNIQSTEVFMSSGSTWSDIMDICGHTFVQTHRVWNNALPIGVSPKVTWGCSDYVSAQSSLV